MPDKTEKKQGKFRIGQSGNPLGRPRGIRNKATIAAEALFEGEIEGICRKAIEEAKRGNIQAIDLNPALAISLQKSNGLQNEKTGNIVISENVSRDVPMTGLLSSGLLRCPVTKSGSPVKRPSLLAQTYATPWPTSPVQKSSPVGELYFAQPSTGAFSNQFLEGIKQLYELELFIRVKPYLTNQWEKGSGGVKKAV